MPARGKSWTSWWRRLPGAYVVDNVDWHITAREAMRMLEPFQHRICVIDFDEGAEKGSRVSQRLRDGCDTSLAIFAAAASSDPEQIMAAMRSGCSEYLVKPFEPERISHALAHIAARPQGKSGELEKGRIMTVMGAKGGTGATSLALHLALNLVQRHRTEDAYWWMNTPRWAISRCTSD